MSILKSLLLGGIIGIHVVGVARGDEIHGMPRSPALLKLPVPHASSPESGLAAASPWWFADGRLSFEHDAHGVTRVHYFSPTVADNNPVLLYQRLWEGFRLFVHWNGESYAPDFLRARVTPWSVSAPDASGDMPPAYYERMKELRTWMTTAGETVFGTTPGPYPEQCGVPVTVRGDTWYVFLLPPDSEYRWDHTLHQVPRPAEVRLLRTGQPVAFDYDAKNRELRFHPDANLFVLGLNEPVRVVLSAATQIVSGAGGDAKAPIRRPSGSREDRTNYRLAESGASRVTVLCRGKRAPLVETAVADLARCLGKALGVTVPLARQESDVRTPLVIEVAEAQQIEGLARDGFVLKTAHNRLLISGISANGISDGIYTLLAESFGCRWLQPGELWEVAPSRPEAMLPSLDVLRNPPFRYRIFSHNGAGSEVWNQRNRATVDMAGLPAYGFGHNLNHVFPPRKFGQTHPEFYALIGGVRKIPKSDGEQFANPCFSNPQLAEIAAAAAGRYFEEHPAANTFSLCVNDTSEHCHCESCQALDRRGGRGQGGAEGISESYFHFVNETARIVARTHPGKYLGVYAYWSVYASPKALNRLPANVVVQLTQDGAQFHDPAYRACNEADWRAWRAKASRIGHYDYYSLGWFTPRFYPHLASQTIRFLASQQADGFYCEIYPNWCWAAPQCWMMARLLWNPRQSADALLDEFCRTAYGPAAKEMRAFYDTCEQYWHQPRKGAWFDGLSDFNAEMRIANRHLMERAWAQLERAAGRAQGVEAKRVAYVRDHFQLPYLMVTSYVAARDLTQVSLRTSVDLAELAQGIQTLAARETEAVRVWETVWEADKTYPSTYYDRPNFTGKWNNQWKPDFSRWLMVATRQAERFCRERGDLASWEDFFSTLPRNVAIDRATVERHGEVRARSVTIDGNAADWADVPSHTLYRLEPGGDYQDSPSDAHARVRVAHDVRHFYVLVEADEAELIQRRRDGEIWKEDAVQITIHPDTDAIRTPGLDDQTTELGFAFPDAQPFVWRWHGPQRAPGPTKEVFLAVRRSARKTIYEAAIPWRELGVRQPKPGKRIGFSIALVDAGANRNAAYFGWGGGVLFGKDLRLLVPMTLQ